MSDDKRAADALADGTWAKLSLFGHKTMGGKLTSVTVAGKGMIRIDVPETDGVAAYTEFVSPDAVYSISPLSEAAARAVAAAHRHRPVTAYELPEPPAGLPHHAGPTLGASEYQDAEDDWDDDDDRDPTF